MCSSLTGHSGVQARLDAELLGNLGRYRRYRGSSLRDLLRVIRNKHNHWRELPEALQQRLGPPPDGFLMCAARPVSANTITNSADKLRSWTLFSPHGFHQAHAKAQKCQRCGRSACCRSWTACFCDLASCTCRS